MLALGSGSLTMKRCDVGSACVEKYSPSPKQTKKTIVTLEKGKDMEVLFSLFDTDTLSDVVVLHNVRSMENCSKIQKSILENESQELFCCLTQTIGWMKAMSGLLSLSAFPHTRCPIFETCEQCMFRNWCP